MYEQHMQRKTSQPHQKLSTREKVSERQPASNYRKHISVPTYGRNISRTAEMCVCSLCKQLNKRPTSSQAPWQRNYRRNVRARATTLPCTNLMAAQFTGLLWAFLIFHPKHV